LINVKLILDRAQRAHNHRQEYDLKSQSVLSQFEAAKLHSIVEFTQLTPLSLGHS
jgi:hypothetical protein